MQFIHGYFLVPRNGLAFRSTHTHLFGDAAVESVHSEERAALEVRSDALALHVVAVAVHLAVREETVVSHPAQVADQ